MYTFYKILLPFLSHEFLGFIHIETYSFNVCILIAVSYITARIFLMFLGYSLPDDHYNLFTFFGNTNAIPVHVSLFTYAEL